VSDKDTENGKMKLDVYEHIIGDERCQECWRDYPKKCKCGGLIHASFGDEDEDCEYWLYEMCDKCGENYNPLCESEASKDENKPK